MSRDKIKKARAASLTMSEQDRLEIKRLDSSPDETKTFEKAKLYNANFKGLTIGKAILQLHLLVFLLHFSSNNILVILALLL